MLFICCPRSYTLDLSPAHIPKAKAEPCIIIKSLGLRRKLHVTTKRQDHHKLKMAASGGIHIQSKVHYHY